MIKITEKAGSALLESSNASGLEEDQVLRLSEDEGQYLLFVDSPKDTDSVIEHENTPVLAVDRELEDRLPDSLIDIEDSLDGPKLNIKPLSLS